MIINQSNFNAGEISPELHAHVDINKFKNGLSTSLNSSHSPRGPVSRRNGFKYINGAKSNSVVCRLIPFVYNMDNAYILEFGDLYIRFFTNNARVESGGSPVEVVSPYATADLPYISFVQYGNVLYIAHKDYAPRQLTFTNSTTWTLEQIDFFPPALKEQGHKPATTITPAATSGTGINFTAGSATFLTGDVGRQIQNLSGAGVATITSYTSNTVVVCTILENFPNTSAIASQSWKIDLSPVVEITPTGIKEGSIQTFDADAIGTTTAIEAFRPTGFSALDAGSYVVANNGVAEIISVPAAGTSCSADIQKGLSAVSETQVWSIESPAWSSTNGYPRAVALHQQRLCFGGTTVDPQTVWMSQSGLFDSIGTGTNDSDAISVDISSAQVNQVNWMVNIKNSLVVGTSGGEIQITAGSYNGPITPTTVTQDVLDYEGSGIQQPVVLGNEVLYIQNSGYKLNALKYEYQADSYQNEDLLFLCPHLVTGGLKELALAKHPWKTIYTVTNDGDLLVATYIRSQEVLAWSKWQTTGSFESVAVIPSDTHDQVWVAVKRTVNGSTKRYIEKLDYSTGEDRLDGFSDCYLTYSTPKTITGITKANPAVVTSAGHGLSNGDIIKIIDVEGMTEVNGHSYTIANVAANTFELSGINSSSYTTYVSGGEAHELVSTISGLSHLEGESVEVKVDGCSHPARTVSGGSITLAQPAFEVVVGLGYDWEIKFLPLEFNTGQGSMQGQRARWVKPILNLYKSRLPLLEGEFLPARDATMNMDADVELFTGFASYGAYTWEQGLSLTVSLSAPFPCMVRSITGTIESGII